MVRTIQLCREDYDIILQHSLDVWDEEACGLIAGADRSDGIRDIRKVYILENKDHSPEHFTLDLHEQLAAIRDMRAKGLVPLGNWHSHPHTPSRQSAEDIRLAFDSHASYLILSLQQKDSPVLHSFHTENGISTMEGLIITEE